MVGDQEMVKINHFACTCIVLRSSIKTLIEFHIDLKKIEYYETKNNRKNSMRIIKFILYTLDKNH